MIAEVIGSPMAHSGSPDIHRQWIRALGINATFSACQVEPGELSYWLEQRRVGKMWRGCSFTAPLKQLAATQADSLTHEAKRLGAVNLICNDGKKLIGHNTDLEGIRTALAPRDFRTGKIVIAGAGGATAAALAYAIDQNFAEISVIARDPGRVFDRLASRFAAPFRIVHCDHAHLAVRDADLLISATPMGSRHGAPMRTGILAALAGAAPGAVVLDMNYDPVRTELLIAAERAGLIPVSGMDILIGQARRAFELLFGRSPPDQPNRL